MEIDGYTLLPVFPDWNRGPQWQREWETEVASAVSGAETRRAMRAVGRVSLTWSIMVQGVAEVAWVNELIVQAEKTGKACAPLWGRGCWVGSAAGDVCTHTGSFPWRAGDWAFFLNDALGVWEVKQVDDVAGDVLTLAEDLEAEYTAEHMVWPVLFGRFTPDFQECRNAERISMRMKLRELVSRESVVIGDPPPAPPEGVGAWAIGSEFLVA